MSNAVLAMNSNHSFSELCASPRGLQAGSFELYIQSLRRVPLMTAEEEKSCAERFQAENDLQAAQRLVVAHLRYVAHVAHQYRHYGLAVSDLMQEGTIGLMKAVKRFDPKVGVRLVSFAVHWIKAEIHEFVIRNWRIVRVATTKAQRKLFFNMRAAKQRLGWMHADEVAMVAADLGVKPQEVLEMEQRLQSQEDWSFDGEPAESAGQSSSGSSPNMLVPAEFLQIPEADPLHQLEQEEKQAAEEDLYRALSCLDPRCQAIIKERWLSEEKATFKDLGARWGISIERVRQIEQSAIKQLGTFFNKAD